VAAAKFIRFFQCLTKCAALCLGLRICKDQIRVKRAVFLWELLVWVTSAKNNETSPEASEKAKAFEAQRGQSSQGHAYSDNYSIASVPRARRVHQSCRFEGRDSCAPACRAFQLCDHHFQELPIGGQETPVGDVITSAQRKPGLSKLNVDKVHRAMPIATTTPLLACHDTCRFEGRDSCAPACRAFQLCDHHFQELPIGGQELVSSGDNFSAEKARAFEAQRGQSSQGHAYSDNYSIFMRSSM
jgi:hypothetical protein